MRGYLLLGALLACLLSACKTTYMPPGPKADLKDFAPPDMQEEFARQPSNPFPASIAVVRVQGSAYVNYHIHQYGGAYGCGKYTIVSSKELDEETQLGRIADLPQVEGLVSLNRMLLQDQTDSEKAIRAAAARLQADLVFLYTLDTNFFDINLAKPLSVVTLGLSPTKKVSVITTASGLLVDTRTGYVYAAYEATEKAGTLATSWGSEDAADKARQKTEQQAFAKLVDEFISTWPDVLKRHQPKA